MEKGFLLSIIIDPVVSKISKKEAHLKSRHNVYPHRAFSVFLFNQDNELLIQRRAHKKVTFPGLWFNTCCSHPLNTAEERNERYHEGIKRAAVRRMKFKLRRIDILFKP
jgi:isopentenyl-diphosphate delta-isomerase